MEKDLEILAYFPLSIFLFPGEDIPLRIFEPRYKQLIEDIRKSDSTFVIPYVADEHVKELGCEVRLKDMLAENPGGRMVITVESVSIVKILSFKKQLEGKLYAGGTFRRLPCSDRVESNELLSLIKNYSDHFDNEFLSCIDPAKVTRQEVMKALNLPSNDKYRFMCMPEGEKRDEYLAGQLRYLRMIRTQESLLGNDFGLN